MKRRRILKSDMIHLGYTEEAGREEINRRPLAIATRVMWKNGKKNKKRRR